MTDDPVRTEVRTDDGWLEFQEYFVHRHQEPTVHEVRFDGLEAAAPTPEVRRALAAARRHRHLPVEPDRLDRADPRRARHAGRHRRARGRGAPGRGVSADHRRPGAQGPGRPDARVARPRVDRARRRAAATPTWSTSSSLDAVDAALAPAIEALGMRAARHRHGHDRRRGPRPARRATTLDVVGRSVRALSRRPAAAASDVGHGRSARRRSTDGRHRAGPRPRGVEVPARRPLDAEEREALVARPARADDRGRPRRAGSPSGRRRQPGPGGRCGCAARPGADALQQSGVGLNGALQDARAWAAPTAPARCWSCRRPAVSSTAIRRVSRGRSAAARPGRAARRARPRPPRRRHERLLLAPPDAIPFAFGPGQPADHAARGRARPAASYVELDGPLGHRPRHGPSDLHPGRRARPARRRPRGG